MVKYFQIIHGYDILDTVASYQKAVNVIKEQMELSCHGGITYKQVDKVKTTFTDHTGTKHNAWYITYQYSTLYFATYLVIESMSDKIFVA